MDRGFLFAGNLFSKGIKAIKKREKLAVGILTHGSYI